MYKFKTSEQNNDKATEFETKSLLYLLTKIKGHSGISLFIIDCFNDVTGVAEDLFSSKGIPLYFIHEVQGMDEEDIADLIQECQTQISRTLFNKNNKRAFWLLLEEVMTTLEKNPSAGIRAIFKKMTAQTKNRLFTLDESALLYLIALVKEGLKNENS